MGTIIIVVILIVIIALAVRSAVHRARHGSACCGERDSAPKKVKVADKNKAHYPFSYTLGVEGMHCANCVRFVENALNSLDGVWATANLEKKSVVVLAKAERNPDELKKAVSEAGYTVFSMEGVAQNSTEKCKRPVCRLSKGGYF